MIVSLPLTLTGTYANANIPKSVSITYSNSTLNNVNIIDSSITTSHFWMPQSSGYDASGSRITNIVGFDGANFLKLCPKCNHIKTTIEFGASGRVTNGVRDQSNCNDCRKQ